MRFMGGQRRNVDRRRKMLFVRSATIAPGRFAEAMSFAREMASYVKSKAGVDVKVFTQLGGIAGRIAWQAEFKGLAAYEQFLTQFVPDPGYQEITKKAGPLFVAGETRDSLWVEPPPHK
jgi:hypothetical protein